MFKNAWDRYHKKRGKEKAARYYMENREVLKEDARSRYKSLSKKQKNIKRRYQRERHHTNTDLNEKLKQNQRDYYASKR